MVKLQISSQGKVYVTANNKALVANEPTGTKHITSNGTHDVKNYATANVNITPNFGTKYISANGTYEASTDNYDGFSSVTVNVSGSGGEGGADPLSVISQNTVGGTIFGMLSMEWLPDHMELSSTVFANLTGLTLSSDYNGNGYAMWGNIFVDNPINVSTQTYSTPSSAWCYVGIDEYTDPSTSQQTSGWVIKPFFGDPYSSTGQGFPTPGKNCYCVHLNAQDI